MSASQHRAITRALSTSRFETAVGRHRFVTDHTGVGPTPPDHFVASLAGCIAVYVASYCRNVGLDPTGLEVELSWERDEARLSDFGVAIRLPRAIVGPRAEAIRRVADACLVHETIRTFGSIRVEIRDAVDDEPGASDPGARGIGARIAPRPNAPRQEVLGRAR